MKSDSCLPVSGAVAQGKGSTIVPVPLAKVQQQQKLLVSVAATSASAASSQAEADIVEEDKLKEGHDSKKSLEEGSVSQEDASSSEKKLHLLRNLRRKSPLKKVLLWPEVVVQQKKYLLWNRR
jgi:hypothetical protein